MSQGHRIETLSFECGFGDEALAWAQQPRLDEFMRSRGQRVIEEALERHAPPDDVVSIERLEVDLGLLDPSDGDDAWCERLERRLEDALGGLRGGPPFSGPAAGRKNLSAPEHAVAAFAHYLEHGVLPWSLRPRSRADFEAWLNFQAQEAGEAFWGALSARFGDGRTRRILREVLPQASLDALLRHVYRDWPKLLPASRDSLQDGTAEARIGPVDAGFAQRRHQSVFSLYSLRPEAARATPEGAAAILGLAWRRAYLEAYGRPGPSKGRDSWPAFDAAAQEDPPIFRPTAGPHPTAMDLALGPWLAASDFLPRAEREPWPEFAPRLLRAARGRAWRLRKAFELDDKALARLMELLSAAAENRVPDVHAQAALPALFGQELRNLPSGFGAPLSPENLRAWLWGAALEYAARLEGSGSDIDGLARHWMEAWRILRGEASGADPSAVAATRDSGLAGADPVLARISHGPRPETPPGGLAATGPESAVADAMLRHGPMDSADAFLQRWSALRRRDDASSRQALAQYMHYPEACALWLARRNEAERWQDLALLDPEGSRLLRARVMELRSGPAATGHDAGLSGAFWDWVARTVWLEGLPLDAPWALERVSAFMAHPGPGDPARETSGDASLDGPDGEALWADGLARLIAGTAFERAASRGADRLRLALLVGFDLRERRVRSAETLDPGTLTRLVAVLRVRDGNLGSSLAPWDWLPGEIAGKGIRLSLFAGGDAGAWRSQLWAWTLEWAADPGSTPASVPSLRAHWRRTLGALTPRADLLDFLEQDDPASDQNFARGSAGPRGVSRVGTLEASSPELAGVSGFAGVTGLAGVAGAGAAGPAGSTGLVADEGFAGATGLPGASGLAGADEASALHEKKESPSAPGIETFSEALDAVRSKIQDRGPSWLALADLLQTPEACALWLAQRSEEQRWADLEAYWPVAAAKLRILAERAFAGGAGRQGAQKKARFWELVALRVWVQGKALSALDLEDASAWEKAATADRAASGNSSMVFGDTLRFMAWLGAATALADTGADAAGMSEALRRKSRLRSWRRRIVPLLDDQALVRLLAFLVQDPGASPGEPSLPASLAPLWAGMQAEGRRLAGLGNGTERKWRDWLWVQSLDWAAAQKTDAPSMDSLLMHWRRTLDRPPALDEPPLAAQGGAGIRETPTTGSGGAFEDAAAPADGGPWVSAADLCGELSHLARQLARTWNPDLRCRVADLLEDPQACERWLDGSTEEERWLLVSAMFPVEVQAARAWHENWRLSPGFLSADLEPGRLERKLWGLMARKFFVEGGLVRVALWPSPDASALEALVRGRFGLEEAFGAAPEARPARESSGPPGNGANFQGQAAAGAGGHSGGPGVLPLASGAPQAPTLGIQGGGDAPSWNAAVGLPFPSGSEAFTELLHAVLSKVRDRGLSWLALADLLQTPEACAAWLARRSEEERWGDLTAYWPEAAAKLRILAERALDRRGGTQGEDQRARFWRQVALRVLVRGKVLDLADLEDASAWENTPMTDAALPGSLDGDPDGAGRMEALPGVLESAPLGPSADIAAMREGLRRKSRLQPWRRHIVSLLDDRALLRLLEFFVEWPKALASGPASQGGILASLPEAMRAERRRLARLAGGDELRWRDWLWVQCLDWAVAQKPDALSVDSLLGHWRRAWGSTWDSDESSRQGAAGAQRPEEGAPTSLLPMPAGTGPAGSPRERSIPEAPDSGSLEAPMAEEPYESSGNGGQDSGGPKPPGDGREPEVLDGPRRPRPEGMPSQGAPEAAPQAIWVANAGVVLLANFLPRLFDRLELCRDGRFVDDSARERAVHCLEYLVHGTTETPEAGLALAKLLCGMPLLGVVRPCPGLGKAAEETLDSLLRAVIAHWSILGNTSVEGLRGSFLRREGRLDRGDDPAWNLKVEPRTFDMLLDRLPWSYNPTKLAWMGGPLYVDWR